MSLFRVVANITGPKPGLPGVNVWHVKTQDVSPLSELDRALDALKGFYTTLAPYLAPAVTVTLGQDVLDIQEQSDEIRTARTVTSTASAAPGDLAPLLAIVIGWRTDLRARRGMGRTFVGPLADAAIATDGTPSSSAMLAAQNAGQALVDSNNTVPDFDICVNGLRDPKNTRQLEPDGTFAREFRPFTGVKIRDQFGAMRSRRD